MKQFILSIGLAATAAFAYANPVSVQTAQAVATNFISKNGATSNPVLQLSKAYPSAAASAQTAMYVFDVDNGNGFVIVSGDDAVKPVLGYSAEDAFPQQITNNEVAYWMNGYNEQISYVISNHLVATQEVAASWNALSGSATGNNHTAGKPTDIAPMMSTKWDQMNPFNSSGNSLYNNFCPTSTPTGCVATAMAQIMYYWGSPASGTGSHSYSSSPVPQGMTLSADFDTTYDWANMPIQLANSSSSVQKKAVALLMYHCGVAVEMNYDYPNNGGSGAYVINYGQASLACSQNAFKNYFGYSTDIKGLKRSSYPVDSIWISKLVAELNAGRPVLYTGRGSAGGHAFDFDGYQTSTNMFHINWGWSGQSNGYFTIDNLAPSALGVGGGGGNFNTDQEALINIRPTGTVPDLEINTALTASQTSIATGAAFTVTANIKNSGNGALTNGSLVGGVYNASGSTLIGYMQILTNQSLAPGGDMTVTFSTPGIAAMVPGTYVVKALYKETASETTWSVVSNGASQNAVTITVGTTGLNEIDETNTVKIYPNPAKDFVNIDWSSFNGNVKGLQLFNIIGQKVWSDESALKNKNINVPVDNLTKGIYIVNIVTDKGTISKKIAVK